MQEMPSDAFNNLGVFVSMLLLVVGVLVVYLVLMVRTVLDMLRCEAHGVVLTFAFLALIPFPPILIMGIMVMIIWHLHKRDLSAGERQTTRTPARAAQNEA